LKQLIFSLVRCASSNSHDGLIYSPLTLKRPVLVFSLVKSVIGQGRTTDSLLWRLRSFVSDTESVLEKFLPCNTICMLLADALYASYDTLALPGARAEPSRGLTMCASCRAKRRSLLFTRHGIRFVLHRHRSLSHTDTFRAILHIPCYKLGA